MGITQPRPARREVKEVIVKRMGPNPATMKPMLQQRQQQHHVRHHERTSPETTIPVSPL